MTLSPHIQSKINLLAAREFFFQSILKALMTEAQTIEVLIGSDSAYVSPRLLSMDVEFGSLVIEVAPNFIGEGEESRYYYSISVMGDMLRVGIFMPISSLLAMPVSAEIRSRLQRTWRNETYCMQDHGNGVLYEWAFTEFNPENWSNSEKYILGLRYLHFCFLEQLHHAVLDTLAPKILLN